MRFGCNGGFAGGAAAGDSDAGGGAVGGGGPGGGGPGGGGGVVIGRHRREPLAGTLFPAVAPQRAIARGQMLAAGRRSEHGLREFREFRERRQQTAASMWISRHRMRPHLPGLAVGWRPGTFWHRSRYGSPYRRNRKCLMGFDMFRSAAGCWLESGLPDGHRAGLAVGTGQHQCRLAGTDGRAPAVRHDDEDLGRHRVGHPGHGQAATTDGRRKTRDEPVGYGWAASSRRRAPAPPGQKTVSMSSHRPESRFRRWSSRSPRPPRSPGTPRRRRRTPIPRHAQSREKASASSLSRSSYGLPEMSTVTCAIVPPVNRYGAL
jgi:hypothetical protein